MDRKAGALSLGRAHCMQVLFEQHRFRQTPFEWVYDGLSPVLLADVLDSRKGLSIVLATIYVLVGTDVGLTLTMAPVPRAVVPTLAGTSMRTFCACGSFCVPCSSTPYSYAVTCVASAGASTVHTDTNAPFKARHTRVITSTSSMQAQVSTASALSLRRRGQRTGWCITQVQNEHPSSRLPVLCRMAVLHAVCRRSLVSWSAPSSEEISMSLWLQARPRCEWTRSTRAKCQRSRPKIQCTR